MDAAITPATEGKGIANSPGALAGIKVIDLTRVLGGPYCTMILSDHGAEVIKIEPPQGDEVRDWGPPFHDGDASYFIGINRNKRSLALDLGKPQGKAVLLRLLQDADVLIENFKPGAMEKWGLGYAADAGTEFSWTDPLPHLRLRRRWPAGRAARLRRDPAGDDRPHERQRRRQHRSDAARHRDRQHGHRAVFRDRHPDGVAGTHPFRPRTVSRHDAV